MFSSVFSFTKSSLVSIKLHGLFIHNYLANKPKRSTKQEDVIHRKLTQ